MYNIFETLMNQHGLTHYKVAKESGVDQATLSRWKNGKREPSLETLQVLADYFKVSLDYLRGRTDNPTPPTLTGEQSVLSDTPPGTIKNAPQEGSDELQAYLEELATRPEMRMLFSVTKDATKEDVERAVKIIEALRGTNED